MTSRYFIQSELESLFDKDKLPSDVGSERVIGVSEVCTFASVVEAKKILQIHESVLKANHRNVTNQIEKGRVWMLDLDAFSISRLLLDDGFYERHCNKRGNPFDLSGRISLYYVEGYSYWTENVYQEAFEDQYD